MEQAASDESRPRRVSAPILAFILPGCGHFALGLWTRGLVWLFVEGVMWHVLALLALALTPVLVWGIALGTLALRVAAIIDLRKRWPSEVPLAGRVALAVFAVFVVNSIEAVVVRGKLLETFKVPSGAMLPTIEVGDYVVVDKRVTQPRRGDVIVFIYPKDPSKDFIKRVIAAGGDTVEIRDGQPVVNGRPIARVPVAGECSFDDYDETQGEWQKRPCVALDETFDGRSWRVYQEPGGGPSMRELGPVAIPIGSYFVMGDNRDNSHDSRYWGFVPGENVKGRAVGLYLSLGPDGVRWSRTGLRFK
jgi:signal peptidase I